jgi:hypothetical protein
MILRSRFPLALLLAFTLAGSLASPTQAQFARPGELPPIDAPTRAAIVDSLTAAIDSIYVLEAPAKRIVLGLRKNLEEGAYDELTDPAEFADRLFEDAQAINHDGHFRIFAMPPLNPEVVAAAQDEDPADVERERRRRRANNYGFREAKILPGGVGYVRFDEFGHGKEAFDAAAMAMNFVSNSSAVILDLRQNGGGSAAMIRFICGYFFEDNAHLINWDIRAENLTRQSYSADYVPGQRMLEQPLYILTSGQTFSAAEEFTFDMRNLERATVVGDTTGGGGHTVAGYVYAFDGFRMGIRIPYGRAYNPENNEGWEGVGVIPHIPVPADQALTVAHSEALRGLIGHEEDTEYLAALEWHLQGLQSQLEPMTISLEQLQALAGGYGPRRIILENGVLYYQREDRPRFRLEPMGADLFRVGDLEYFRLSFERDATGAVVKLIGLYDNGRSDENVRDVS